MIRDKILLRGFLLFSYPEKQIARVIEQIEILREKKGVFGRGIRGFVQGAEAG
jgi:hypothetical protein